ncbi:hypothetical protein [Sphingobacterium faecale]|uniref:Uncharacterized protein n=1 Tax=Sphingobacterium faecale TaxID=2803775 RepID=A0ABS1R1U9_9SPHI|nr:hypothetical protein [Sphingobacterium faecale]MBL1408679.1 hypothetical protein [Sphingobacterium faecale]
MQRNDKLRTSFGQYMMDHFEDQRLKEISTENDIIDVHLITGIELPRLRNIYFNGGSPQVFEFILIEKAMGMDPGQMIKDFISKYPI